MFGPIAQRIEQRPFKPLVEGSNPSGPTKKKKVFFQNPAKLVYTRFMPNWCSNILKVSGDSATLLQFEEFISSERSTFDFSAVIPYPALFAEMDKDMPAWNDPDKVAKQAEYEEKYKFENVKDRLLEIFGFANEDSLSEGKVKWGYTGNGFRKDYEKNWKLTHDGYNNGGYNWCCANWGTKWWVSDDDVVLENYGDNIEISFDTAWSPPRNVVERLAELYPTLNFHLMYEEPGCNFAGDITFEGGVVIDENDYECLPDEDGDLEAFTTYREYHGLGE
jgi:hypothetical protein